MSNTLNLIPDAPISNASFDRLDRMAFVQSFAEAIRAAKGEYSVVLALAGPWGSGKSSLLNLIAGELVETETEKEPLLVRFNPWWFTGTGELVPAFLQQLGAALSRPEVKDVLGGATEALDQLADSLARPGEMHRRDLDARDIQLVRERVVEIFRKSDRRIIVFMDDIDRITPDEMSQMLLIVRAIADFPNTTYVLSLDYEVVVEALENKLGVNGRVYLEKVIQLQIDVPVPTRMTMERMVIGQLAAIDPDSQGLDEESRAGFRMLFESGIKHFLVTPRACTRFLNVVRFIYPTVKDQVFLPDLLGLACLMAFGSQSIQAIRSFQDAFVGPCDERGRGWVDLSTFHDRWLSKIPQRDRPATETVLRLLFPKVAWALNGPIKGDSFSNYWDEKRRICSPKHFDTYFRLGLSAGAATEFQWQNLIMLLDDAASFAKALQQFGPLNDDKAESWIMELLQQASEFINETADSEQAERMFSALMRRGDQVDVFDQETAAERLIEPIHRVVSLLVECLQKIETPTERLHALKESVGFDASLFTATELLEILEHRTDLFAEKGERADTKELGLKVLEVVKLLDERIDSASQNGQLAKHPQLIRILRKWYRYGRKKKVQNWIETHCENDQALVSILLKISEDPTLISDSDRKIKTLIPLELIRSFFNIEKLTASLRRLNDEEPDWISLEGELLISTLIDLLQS